jgi:hypothetical protein
VSSPGRTTPTDTRVAVRYRSEQAEPLPFSVVNRLLRALLAVAAVAILMLAGGCGGESPPPPEEAYAVERPASIAPGDPVPEPVGPVVLTVDGRISNANVGAELQFDLDTLERLRIVSYAAEDEQAEGGVVTFSGVLLSEVLDLAGTQEGATTLDTLALNDYSAPIPLSDPEQYPVMIATRVGGARMDVARFGPIRIVYPNLSYDFDPVVYDSRWNWQLARITVR